MRKLVAIPRTFKNWPTHLADRLNLLPRREVIYRLRSGPRFVARTGTLDAMVIREVWSEREYAPAGFELSADAVVVDVGAHIGSFSVQAALAAPQGRVFAFEPTPDNYAMLLRNVELNGVSNVHALNLALASEPGDREMHLSESSVSHSLYAGLPGVGGTKSVTVRAVTFGEFVNEHRLDRIDLMKLDCEGAEYEILYGCTDEQLRLIRKICMEVHGLGDGRDRPALAAFLKGKGFDVETPADKTHLLYARRR